ncbi:hypothetical protein D9758_007975 [Tetrapyrgos nigripes]|uniref:Uncharacterized protein n=1 Tax=Tetrapyrgos nigripes TaxID=182062 RepID=A0A8H5FVI6_9AGAR|nr:hypothetical protein D9758_007975 [Tetrapyrgos nigripes]
MHVDLRRDFLLAYFPNPLHSVEILGVDLDATRVETGFITLMTLPAVAKSILAFAGTTITFKNLDDAVMLLDTTRPLIEVKLDHPQPELPANQPDSFEAIIQHDYAIVLRPRTLELYSLTRFRRGEDGLQSLSPVLVHQFQFRIDSCRMERHLSPHLLNSPGSNTATPPIHILIRYSSLFPWPVNLLHHYTLYPNPSYDPVPSGTSLDVVNASNSPYYITPVLLHTLSSPVRLFSITDMTLGRYGTALWLDSHTEDYFYQGERGQRLAGRKLSVPENLGNNFESTSPSLESQDQNTEAAASMVFEFNENDDWNRIAVDDKEGWIAIGSTDGEIIVNEYACA